MTCGQDGNDQKLETKRVKDVPKDYALVGVVGRAGDWVDALQFEFAHITRL